MKNLYTVIIPCHNDCESAEKLSKTIPGSVVGHNGCTDRKSFDWSNKAKTINYLAQSISTEYTVVIDADVKMSSVALLAFKREMKEGVKFGCSIHLYLDEKGKIIYSSYSPSISGAMWFIRTELLRSHPVPENIVTEDSAYYEVLKKLKIKAKLITDSVVYVDFYKESFSSSIRQMIRYHLGSFQMFRVKNYVYPGLEIFLLGLSLLMLYCFYDYLSYIVFCTVVVLSGFGLLYFISKKKFFRLINNRHVKKLSVGLLSTFIVPWIALTLFVFNRRIW